VELWPCIPLVYRCHRMVRLSALNYVKRAAKFSNHLDGMFTNLWDNEGNRTGRTRPRDRCHSPPVHRGSFNDA
jgi:hypothetical protein